VAPGGSESTARPSAMTDVARLAGVSHMTVSRVLNDHPNVRPQTRQRVLDAMRKLDFTPNTAARTLATRRSNTLGIVTVDTTLFGPAAMVYGFEQAARDAGYFVTIATVRSLTPKAVVSAVNRLREQAVEGVVAIVPDDAGADALRSVASDLPVIAIGVGEHTDVPTVGVDNAAGAAMATEHLLRLGHATVHHVAGPQSWPEARERLSGWRQALHAAGAPVPEWLVGSWSARSGYELGRQLVDDAVTAVFCANDHMALGVLRAFAESGRQVPVDVSVVGFDDIPEAPFMIPPLTTVRQDFGALGRHSVDLLRRLGASAEADGTRSVRLRPKLKIRRSAARPHG
jgi:DNA-binding LacI/PurR family transcriptional regulator